MEHQIKTAIEEFQEREKWANQERAAVQLEKIANAMKEQVEAAKKQADAAQEQAVLAKQESEVAKKDAAAAKRQSKINTWIAVAAIVVALLAWLIPREAVYAATSAFFQSL